MGKCFGASGQVADAQVVLLTLDKENLYSYWILLVAVA
jgi:hypothetical protein